MQNPTSFDLNRAIHDWRARMADSPALRTHELHELEGHLRDSIKSLRSLHLSEEDCFVLATHRLGSTAQLTAEFSKVKRRNIWLERVMWMLAGSLLLGFVGGLAGTVARIIILIPQNSLTNPNWLSALSAAMALGFFSLGIFVVWRMLLHPPAFFRTGLRALFRNRAIAILTLLSMTTFSGLISYFAFRHHLSTYSHEAMGRLVMAQAWSAGTTSIASSLFIIITFVCLAKRHLHPSTRQSSS
jgi:hypothetical protein